MPAGSFAAGTRLACASGARRTDSTASASPSLLVAIVSIFASTSASLRALVERALHAANEVTCDSDWICAAPLSASTACLASMSVSREKR